MYLDAGEKRRLAATICSTLAARGGHWICADIYVRSEHDGRIVRSERARAFLAAHRVEENKFTDWAAAEAFFTDSDFVIERRLVPGWPGLAVSGTGQHARETWLLRPRVRG